MANIVTDFHLAIQQGIIPGHALVHKFGRNTTVANGAWEGIYQLSTAFTFLSAATTVRVKAGNVADTANGAGAREITVEGLDNTGAFVSEAIDTAGDAASAATAASFWRVFRAYVSASGTYGAANTGQVIIENSAGGTDIISIAAAEGQSQYGAYAIPLGKTGYLLSVMIQTDAAQVADFRLLTRESLTDTSAPVEAPRIKLFFDGIADQLIYQPVSPILTLPALTDIWMEAQGGGGIASVACNFEILLVDD